MHTPATSPQNPNEQESAECLWLDAAQTRYFLLNMSDRDLPVDNSLISSLSGEQKAVDLAAIAPLEITEAAATAHLEAQLDRAKTSTTHPAIGEPNLLDRLLHFVQFLSIFESIAFAAL